MTALPMRPESLRFTIVLGLLAALPSLSIDISQPMLLTVQAQLQAPAQTVGLTITVFMLGFAAGQFAGGPLSDRHGRRPMLLASLLAYIMAALGCSQASSAEALLGWRFLQGIGSGACAVTAFSIIRDLFEGDVARAKRAYVIAVLGLAPLCAPALGAWILGYVGWRPVYLLLAAGGLLLLAAVTFGIAESRPAPHGGPRRNLVDSYRLVLSDRRFLSLTVLNALSYGGIFAYIAGSPQVLMGSMSLTGGQYGAFFACTAGALTMGAFVSGRCTKAGIGPSGLLWISLIFAATSATALAILLASNVFSLFALLPLLLVNMFCRGVTAPNAQHMALDPMRDQAGTAAAVVGVLQILTGALSSAFVALSISYAGPSGMALVMATLAIASLFLWLAVCRVPASD